MKKLPLDLKPIWTKSALRPTPQPLHKSLGCAFRGIRFAIVSQRNMKIHLAAAVIVTLLGSILHVSKQDWIHLIFCIFIVLICETLNASLEQNVDLVTKKRKLRAMLAKDMAAGAVLLSSVLAVIIGFLIFFDKIKHWVNTV